MTSSSLRSPGQIARPGRSCAVFAAQSVMAPPDGYSTGKDRFGDGGKDDDKEELAGIEE
jgi:hypothetical protein